MISWKILTSLSDTTPVDVGEDKTNQIKPNQTTPHHSRVRIQSGHHSPLWGFPPGCIKSHLLLFPNSNIGISRATSRDMETAALWRKDINDVNQLVAVYLECCMVTSGQCVLSQELKVCCTRRLNFRIQTTAMLSALRIWGLHLRLQINHNSCSSRHSIAFLMCRRRQQLCSSDFWLCLDLQILPGNCEHQFSDFKSGHL